MKRSVRVRAEAEPEATVTKAEPEAAVTPGAELEVCAPVWMPRLNRLSFG